MKIKFLLTLAITFLTISSVYAHAPGDDAGSKKLQQMRAEFIQKLELTENQQTQLEKHKKRSRALGMELMMTLRDLKFKLREELNRYYADTTEVERLALEIKNIQTRILEHRISTISTIKSIISPEQFEIFTENIRKFRGVAMGLGGFVGGPPWGRL